MLAVAFHNLSALVMGTGRTQNEENAVNCIAIYFCIDSWTVKNEGQWFLMPSIFLLLDTRY